MSAGDVPPRLPSYTLRAQAKCSRAWVPVAGVRYLHSGPTVAIEWTVK